MESNVEIIQELYRSFKEKDYDSFKVICDKDISWRQNPGFPKGGSYHGAEEVINNVFKAFDDSWENWKFIVSFPRSCVGMPTGVKNQDEVWIPTVDRGNRANSQPGWPHL
jgi:hypothetical protein